MPASGWQRVTLQAGGRRGMARSGKLPLLIQHEQAVDRGSSTNNMFFFAFWRVRWSCHEQGFLQRYFRRVITITLCLAFTFFSFSFKSIFSFCLFIPGYSFVRSEILARKSVCWHRSCSIWMALARFLLLFSILSFNALFLFHCCFLLPTFCLTCFLFAILMSAGVSVMDIHCLY